MLRVNSAIPTAYRGNVSTPTDRLKPAGREDEWLIGGLAVSY